MTDQVQVNFRMPIELRDRLKEDAFMQNRSMNAEIIARLQSTYRRKTPEEATEEVIAYLTGMSRAIREDDDPMKLKLIEILKVLSHE